MHVSHTLISALSLKLALVCLALTAYMAGFGVVLFYLDKYAARFDRPAPQPFSGSARRVAIMSMIVPGGAAGALGFMILIMVALFVLVSPFYTAGKRAAADAAASNFDQSSVVTLALPSESSRSYRLILCSSQFCALYASDRVIAVPVSAITLAVGSLPK